MASNGSNIIAISSESVGFWAIISSIQLRQYSCRRSVVVVIACWWIYIYYFTHSSIGLIALSSYLCFSHCFVASYLACRHSFNAFCTNNKICANNAIMNMNLSFMILMVVCISIRVFNNKPFTIKDTMLPTSRKFMLTS